MIEEKVNNTNLGLIDVMNENSFLNIINNVNGIRIRNKRICRKAYDKYCNIKDKYYKDIKDKEYNIKDNKLYISKYFNIKDKDYNTNTNITNTLDDIHNKKNININNINTNITNTLNDIHNIYKERKELIMLKINYVITNSNDELINNFNKVLYSISKKIKIIT